MLMMLEGLRSVVGRIERGGVSAQGGAGGRSAPPAWPAVALGLPALDQALPEGGIARGRMHEVVAEEGEAGTGFAALLLARLLGESGRALWCGRSSRTGGVGPYAPGAAEFGIAPEQLILARTPGDAETLWAMEEGLRCPALAAVLGEVAALDLTAGRRLQLAAERHGVTALVLRRPLRAVVRGAAQRLEPSAARRIEPSAAATRWRVAPLPGEDAERARWRVELLRCRGGVPRDFVLDWSHGPGNPEGFAAGGRAVAAAPGDGPGPSRAAPQEDAAD